MDDNQKYPDTQSNDTLEVQVLALCGISYTVEYSIAVLDVFSNHWSMLERYSNAVRISVLKTLISPLCFF